MRWLAPAIALSLITMAPAWAQPPNTVSELVVMPRAKCLAVRRNADAPPPRIVSTFPADGAVIRPGRLVVRVTFNRPMTCAGFFQAVPPLPSPCLANRQDMVFSFDHRTVRLLCSAAPDTTYALRIGAQLLNPFVSLDGRPAQPRDLTFSTGSGPAVETVSEALAQDR